MMEKAVIEHLIFTNHSSHPQLMSKMTIRLIIKCTLATVLFVFNSCYYENEEELYPGGCQTDDVTYSGAVLPIIQTNCYRCHDAQNNQGGVTLEGYDKLKFYVDNGRLLGAIRRETGFSPMPQDAAQLSDCSIQQIASWAADGAPDN